MVKKTIKFEKFLIKFYLKISVRGQHLGQRSLSNMSVNSPSAAKQEIVFGRTNSVQKPAVTKSTNDNASDTPQKVQVYIFYSFIE